MPDTESRDLRLRPSRYNLRATVEEGRLILWNTLSRSVSVFEPVQAERVLALLRKSGRTTTGGRLEDYLYERGFLVEEGVDELARVELHHGRQQFRSDVLELILLASEDCNFRCVYCYEGFERGRMQLDVRRGIRRLVAGRLPSLSTLGVSWFGGEPLDGLDAIEDLAPFFRDATREAGVTLVCHMTTNGYLLTEEVAERLLAWEIRDFQVTLDGLAPAHDRKRPTKDGRPTFDVIFDNLLGLHRRADQFNVKIRLNFDRDNVAGLDALLDRLARELGGDQRFEVSFHAVGRWGGSRDDEIPACGGAETSSARRRLRDTARSLGLRVAGSLTEVNRPGAQVCYAARPYSFVVGSDGRLMKCTVALDRTGLNAVGQVHPDGTMTLDEDRLAAWTRPFFEHDDECRRCVLLPTCQGSHCPLRRVGSEARACPGLRSSFKTELREAWGATAAAGRERRLELRGGDHA